MNNNPNIKPAYHLIKFDETRHWSDDVKAQVSRIWGVYAFDRNEATHLCEYTPSYCLVWIAADYAEIDGLSEEARDELNQAILDGSADSDPVTYMHISTVERMVKADPSILLGIDPPELDEDDYADDDHGKRCRWNAVFDDIREGWATGALMY